MARYDPKWVRQFYDEYGEKEWHRLVKSPVHEVRLHVHRHYLEQYVKSGDRVLEIGAGPGRFTQILAELGATVVIVDISPGQLALNRKYARELGFEDAVADRLELDMSDMSVVPDEDFDLAVVYGGPLSYVFENRNLALSEILRVLKPGGIALLGVMSLWGGIHEFLRGVLDVSLEENAEINRTGDLSPDTYKNCTHHCHMFRADEFRSFLEASGAEVLAMSASNCLSAAWGDRLAEIRSDPVKWQQLLQMEIEACRQPGCIDMGTHLIAVIRKR